MDTNFIENSQLYYDLNEQFKGIKTMCTNGHLNPQELAKLFDQIIEHRKIAPCIKALPPTSAGLNELHDPVIRKSILAPSREYNLTIKLTSSSTLEEILISTPNTQE